MGRDVLLWLNVLITRNSSSLATLMAIDVCMLEHDSIAMSLKWL